MEQQTELQQGHKPSASVEAHRRIAGENGKFYNSLIDTYLEARTPEDQQTRVTHLVDNLPGAMKKLYSEGLNKFQEELRANHKLLEQHRGDEVRYLFSSVMSSDGKRAEEIEGILEHSDRARFVEPSPGVAVIEVEKDFFRSLREMGLFHADGHAVAFASDNRGEPSFLVVQRMSLEKSLLEDNSRTAKDSTIRHEFQHFIWNFLERRGDFLRKVGEKTPELAKAFENFRDEVGAYIIEGSRLGNIEADLLVYSSDDEILTTATDARDLAVLCIEIARNKGVNSQTFLYGSMTSRNFAELKDKFTELVPIEGILDQASVASLYVAWVRNDAAGSKLPEFLERKKATVSLSVLTEYGVRRLVAPELTSIGQLYSELDKLKKFADTVKIDTIDDRSILERAVKTRLPLPQETVDKLLTLSRERADNIPLDKSGEEFMESVMSFSFWDIKQEVARNTYRETIASAPSMRKAWNRVRDKIIAKGAKEYRLELGSRKQVASEIQERTRLLMEL